MYPFIHIGHFSIGTFGLCLWLASVCACWALYCNFRRYGVDADAVGVAAYTTVGGVVGANLSGPRRRLYGAARDMIIGMTFATLEGPSSAGAVPPQSPRLEVAGPQGTTLI